MDECISSSALSQGMASVVSKKSPQGEQLRKHMSCNEVLDKSVILKLMVRIHPKHSFHYLILTKHCL